MGISLNWITDSVACQMPIVSPDRPAIAFDRDEPWTWGQVREAEFRYATALQRAGVQHGDRVAVLMKNCLEYKLLLLALARAGAVGVRLNWRLTGPELRFLLKDSGSKVLIVDDELAGAIEPIRGDVPVETYVVRSTGGPVPPWSVSLEEFTSVEGTGEFPELALDDLATIMYTSGTTGLPKGATLTHNNVLWEAAIQAMMWKLDENTVTITSGPLFHAAAWEVVGIPTLMMHGKLVSIPSGGFSLDHLFGLARHHQATLMFTYVHMLYDLVRRDDLEQIVPPSLTRMVVGGDTVMPWLYDEFERRLPHVTIDQSFGATESGMTNTLLHHREAKGHESSVGRPNPLNEVKILRPDGELVGPGEVGEILTRSPSVSVGYWQREEATAETFVDGWCRTGDLGRYDEGGFLTLAGRGKDMVRSGGENIYPVEIEKVLTDHEAIGDAAVVGVPDPKFFEVGCAVLVVKAGMSIDIDSLRDYLGQNLAKFKIPKHFVIVDDLPRNAGGKVLKTVLRETYASLGSTNTSK